MMKKRTFMKKNWAKWPLRRQLFVTMICTVFLVSIIHTVGFGAASLRIRQLVSQYTDTMTQTIGGAVGSAFYQQNICMYSGAVQAQAAYLEDRLLPSEPLDGSALLDIAGQYFKDTFQDIWSPECISFLWIDGQLYTDRDTDILPVMEQLAAESELVGSIPQILDQHAYTRMYSKGENGYFLLWNPFQETNRIGLLVPTYVSYDLSVALTGMLSAENQIASDGIARAMLRSMLTVFGMAAVLLAFFVWIAGKLTGMITTPVEQEQARQERELLLAEEEKHMLKELDRKKTELLANISHELKTPLTVVSSYAQSSAQELSEIPEMAKEVRTMRMIITEVNRMALLVNQLLDLTRIDEGRLRLNRKPLQIDELIKRTLDTYAPMLQQNGNRLLFRRIYDLPEVEADEIRIQEVLVNLLSNAARHTHDGAITVSMAQTADSVEICVTDTGSGIAPEALPHVFERFNADRTSAGSKTSTGLGLYLCRHYVEAHGGTISIESTPGCGTSVRFSLPVAG